jgi:hypothetical protein
MLALALPTLCRELAQVAIAYVPATHQRYARYAVSQSFPFVAALPVASRREAGEMTICAAGGGAIQVSTVGSAGGLR